ncbi:hypothetical protein [Blastomonas sp.]|uniref:hypothetical protein n=1 Tax=Blastomonas sp. TaxID=1909299 RepID=UPI0017DE9068|nr:hypothetical protein [Blastomonas sp.]
MARISSAARRSTMRSALRTRRPARTVQAGTGTAMDADAKGAGPVSEVEPDESTSRKKLQRKRIKAARATLRAQGRRTGFGRALRSEVRAKHRASARRTRLRSAARRRAQA